MRNFKVIINGRLFSKAASKEDALWSMGARFGGNKYNKMYTNGQIIFFENKVVITTNPPELINGWAPNKTVRHILSHMDHGITFGDATQIRQAYTTADNHVDWNMIEREFPELYTLWLLAVISATKVIEAEL
jgi:hypothetical protein